MRIFLLKIIASNPRAELLIFFCGIRKTEIINNHRIEASSLELNISIIATNNLTQPSQDPLHVKDFALINKKLGSYTIFGSERLDLYNRQGNRLA